MLILAGVTIATLTGDNGIITRTNQAKEETEKAGAKEKVQMEVAGSFDEYGKFDMDKLKENLKNNLGLTDSDITDNGDGSITVTVDGYDIKIEETGSTNIIEVIRMEKYQTEDTKPYLPGSEFKQVEGTNLENGLVVTDGTNYWTWIEVPITEVFKTAKAEDEYYNIEDDLELYTGTLVQRNGYTDQWYDYYGATYDGSSAYSKVQFESSIDFEEAKKYYGAIYNDNIGATEAPSYESSSTIYYVKIDNKLEDDRGCGLTYNEYNSLKKYMLSSLYKNGGFWIGQYEGGSDTYLGEVSSENDTRKLVIKQEAYPYNYITCSDAQKKVSELNSGDYKSSLIFGIQWDLILKHLQIRGGIEVADLTSDSKNWGNYNNTSYIIENGKYTTSAIIMNPNCFKAYTESTSGWVENITKIENKSVLLTTGASKRNMKMNIYDLAGNIREWTLEKSANASYPCVTRGGDFAIKGTYTAAFRDKGSISSGYFDYRGFRPALY